MITLQELAAARVLTRGCCCDSWLPFGIRHPLLSRGWKIQQRSLYFFILRFLPPASACCCSNKSVNHESLALGGILCLAKLWCKVAFPLIVCCLVHKPAKAMRLRRVSECASVCLCVTGCLSWVPHPPRSGQNIFEKCLKMAWQLRSLYLRYNKSKHGGMRQQPGCPS